jgi:hypothetical protein
MRPKDRFRHPMRAAAAALGLALLAAAPLRAEAPVQAGTPFATEAAGTILALASAENPRLPSIALGGRALPGDITYSRSWFARAARPTGSDAEACLAEAIYFEARGESLKGQVAVAEVVLNRVDSPQFPNTVCRVVRQRGGGGCQFSYVCDGIADRMRERKARQLATDIAAVMLAGAPRRLTDGATYFHTQAVRPRWSRKFERTAAIGEHLFYRRGAGS